MSFKSIIDIDINDEKFKAFLESFQRYSEEAEKAPEDWHKLAAAISGAEKRARGFGKAQGKAFRDGRDQVSAASKSLRGYTGSARQAEASMGAMSTSLGKTTRHQKSFMEAVKGGSSGLKNFSVDTAATALGLDALTGPLAIVAAGVTAIAAGAAKAALSLDKLTAAKAKNAKEMGMTISQQQAFQNYGSQMFENPDAMMAQIYKAKINPANRRGLLAAGLTNQQISTESTPQIAFQFAKNMRARLMGVPANVREAEWNAITGGQFGGAGQVGLLTNTRLSSINGYQAEYKKHQHAYAIQMGTAHNAVRMSQAAAELKGSVVTKLEQGAASRPAMAATMTAIHAGRSAVNGIDWAATSFAAKIGQAGSTLLSDAEMAGRALLRSVGIGKAYARTYGYQDNNPFDLMPGGKLATFSSQTAGIQATARLLRSHYNGQSITQMVGTYAGDKWGTPKANNWELSASKYLPQGVTLDTPMNFDNPNTVIEFLRGLRRAENGIPKGVLPIRQSVEEMPYYHAVKQGVIDGMKETHIHVHGGAGRVAVSSHAAAR